MNNMFEAMGLIDDLLDIARRVVAMLEHQGWRPDGDDPESTLLRDARAAIARAAGGEQ